jgi:hypothetical protein
MLRNCPAEGSACNNSNGGVPKMAEINNSDNCSIPDTDDGYKKIK